MDAADAPSDRAAGPLALLLHALNGLDPVDRRRTGLAAGIAAGGVAAALYSLSCGEVSAGFVLLGPVLLRW